MSVVRAGAATVVVIEELRRTWGQAALSGKLEVKSEGSVRDGLRFFPFSSSN